MRFGVEMMFSSVRKNPQLNLKLHRLADLWLFAGLQLAQRQNHVELAAGEVDLVVAGAFHVDSPAVGFDNALRQRQPKSRAAALETGLAGGMFAQITGLVELGEDDLAEGRVHAHAGIAEDQLHAAAGQVEDGRDGAPADGDFPAVGRKLHRVADDVMEQFSQQVGVRFDRRQPGEVQSQHLLALLDRANLFETDFLDEMS